MSIRSKLIHQITDDSIRHALYRQGKVAKKKRFKEKQPWQWTRNACASTASGHLMLAGVLPQRYYAVYQLVDFLYDRMGWVKTENPQVVRCGGVLFTLDRGGLKGPDHVYLAAGKPGPGPRYDCTVVDNMCGGKAHRRNLGKGGYTPMWFALLPPGDDAVELPMLSASAISEIRSAMTIIYGKTLWSELPDDLKRIFNRDIRRHPVILKAFPLGE